MLCPPSPPQIGHSGLKPVSIDVTLMTFYSCYIGTIGICLVWAPAPLKDLPVNAISGGGTKSLGPPYMGLSTAGKVGFFFGNYLWSIDLKKIKMVCILFFSHKNPNSTRLYGRTWGETSVKKKITGRHWKRHQRLTASRPPTTGALEKVPLS